MKRLVLRLWAMVRRVLAFFLNPRLLLCFGIAWMITNGWCYLFIILGAALGIPWMAAVGGAYAAFLWLPFTPEKLVTVPISIFLLRLLFPHDKATLAVLEKEYHLARAAASRILVARQAKRTLRRMKRAIVVGCPGSGKSHFARRLQALTGLPLVYLDRLYWRADKTTVSQQEFDRALAAALAGERWIIDGNYLRTMEARLAAADTVFFLDYPIEVCLSGIEERRGKPRPDMPWVETEADEEFLSFVRAFPGDSRPRILALLKANPKKQTVVFHTREEADAFLAALQTFSDNHPPVER